MYCNHILMTLISSYIINFPFISKVCKDNGTIIIETDENDFERIKNTMVGEDGIVIPESIGVVATKKLLRHVNSRGIFMLLDCRGNHKFTDKQLEKIDIISSVSGSGLPNLTGMCAATFLLCNGIVPDRLRHFPIIKLRIERSEQENVFEHEQIKSEGIVPEPFELPLIMKEMKKWSNINRFAPLYMAAEVFNPDNCTKGDMHIYEDMFSMLGEIAEAGTSEADEEVVNLFIDFFIQLAKKGQLPEIYELPELEQDVVNNLDSYLYRSGSKLYISEKLFADLCTELVRFVSITDLKAAIKSAGLLTSYSKGYVVKMNYFNIYGATCRASMLQLNIQEFEAADGSKLDYYI